MAKTKTPPHVGGLVDAHCHLDYPPMVDDLDAVFEAGSAAGVVQYVHVGCSLSSIDRAVQLAQAHPPVFAAVGIHPHDATDTSEAVLENLRQHAACPKVVAIGETGLDYHYDRSPRDVQRRSMAEHLQLARALHMPIVLHVRDAHDDALEIFDATGARSENPGMVHCFTAGPDEARKWLDRGFHISFSGIATFKKATDIREAAKLCPADRILLETDAPYLSPEPVRGRKNAPCNVAFTCVRLAEERGEEPGALAERAARNTRELLGIPLPGEKRTARTSEGP